MMVENSRISSENDSKTVLEMTLKMLLFNYLKELCHLLNEKETHRELPDRLLKVGHFANIGVLGKANAASVPG